MKERIELNFFILKASVLNFKVWLALIPVFFALLPAQDSHYWTNQYGTKAQLLGGLVVGSVKDLSSVYYNPGALPSIKDSTMVLSTIAFETNYFIWKNVLGTRKNLDYLQAKPAPAIFAIRVRLGGLKRSNWVVSYLTRQNFEMNLEGRRALTLTGDSENLTDLSYMNEIKFSQRINETWGGITWAYKYNQRLNLGITQFFVLRNQRNRSQIILQAISPDSSGKSLLYIDEYSYWAVRTFWKIGMFLDFSPLTLGITLSTPGLHLFGNGWTFLMESSILSPSETEGGGSNLTGNYRDNIAARYYSPASLSFGASYQLNDTQIHFSGEWFNKVPAYRVMSRETRLEGSGGDVVHELKAVFNWGIAAENRLSQYFTLYSAFSVDRSAMIPGGETKLSVTSWDIYHFTVGSAFFIWKSHFTLGISYSFGGDKITLPISGLRRQVPGIIEPGTNLGEVKSRQLKFLLGLSLRL